MAVRTVPLSIETRGELDIVDITARVADAVKRSNLKEGTATVFVSGSTGAVTTMEFEPGLLSDIPRALERLFPKGIKYAHDETWHDGNGHSHVRASFLGPSLTVPFKDGKLLLGTWQQIVYIELDNKPRTRELVVTLAGE